MQGMTEAVLTAVKASPLAEVPATALRIAAGFASLREADLACVGIRPADADDQVVVAAASPTRAVELLVNGRCKQTLLLPIKPLQSALRRHRDASHAVISEAEGGLVSLRTFGQACTVAVVMAQASGAAINMPTFAPGAFAVEPLRFAPALLISTLRDLQPVGNIQIQPFGYGWILRCETEAVSARAFVAGMKV